MKLALMIGSPDLVNGEGYVRTAVGSYQQTLAQAKQLGFDGVEVMIGRPLAEDMDALWQASRQTGMKVAAFNSGRLFSEFHLSLLDEDQTVREQAAAILLELARLAAPFAAPINIGFFRGIPRPEAHQQAKAQLAAVLRQIADGTGGLGTMLLLEPSNKQELPFICSTAEGITAVREIDHPHVQLMVDTFHMTMEGEDLPASIELAMPYLRHIHFLDLQRNPFSHSNHNGALANVLHVLNRYHYDHYLSMPLLQNGDYQATAAAVASLRP